jgi:hypothetical protein
MRLRLERLEDRITPSTVNWTGAAGDNNWGTVGNWDTPHLPGQSDDVVINKPGAVVLYQGGTTTVKSITDYDTLKVESGSLTTTNNVQQNNGTLQVDGGTLSGGTGIGVSSGTLNYNGGMLSGTVTLGSSALDIGSGGTGAASFVLEGSDTLSGNVAAGQTLWVQGNSVYGSASLTDQGNVANAGTIQLQSIDSSNYYEDLSSGSSTFTNAAGGTIQVNAGSGGGRYLDGNFTNAAGGSVSVGAGIRLTVNGGLAAATFINQGQVNVAANGLMTISQTYDAAGGTISGPGYGYVYSGILEETSNATPTTILVAGNTTLATNNLANMTICVQGNAALGSSPTLTTGSGLFNYGTIQLQSIDSSNYYEDLSSGSSTFTNAAGGTIQVNVGTGGGRIITGTVINDGTINVVGGQTLSIGGSHWSNAGTINVSNDTLDLSGLNGSPFTNSSHGVINIDTTSGNAAISASDTLSNAGTINVAGTDVLYLDNGLTLSNTSTGKLIFTNDSSLFQSGGGTVVNAGTVEKTHGTGTSTIYTTSVNNTGTAAVYSGTLDVTAPVTQVSGSMLSAGSWSAYGSSTVSATLNIGSAGSITTIGTRAKVTLSGLNSSFSNINGSGGLNSIQAGGSFSILSGQSFTTAGNLSNAGTVTLTSGTLNVSGNLSNTGSAILTTSTLNVSGTVAQLSGTSLTGGTWTVNAGSNLKFALGSNIMSLAGAKVMLNGANSNFAALANLASISKTSSFSLLGGRSFTAVGSLTNSGKLTLGPGSTLTANGSFTQTSTASLAIQLGGSNSSPTFGKVVSTSGTVTLGGALQVTSTVVPAVNSSFEILANQGGSPISGTFAGLAEGATFTVKHGSTTMTFKITYVGGSGNNVFITRIS